MFKIKKFTRKKVKCDVLIVGLPGIANVGKIAADFLVDTLNAKEILEIESDSFPNSVFVNSENLVDLYLDKEHINEFNNKRNTINKFNCLHVAVTTPNKNLNIVKRLVRLGIDMVDKSIKEHHYYDVRGDNQTDVNNDDDESKPKTSILEDLRNDPKTPLNLEIETYIIREFYKYHTNN